MQTSQSALHAALRCLGHKGLHSGWSLHALAGCVPGPPSLLFIAIYRSDRMPAMTLVKVEEVCNSEKVQVILCFIANVFQALYKSHQELHKLLSTWTINFSDPEEK